MKGKPHTMELRLQGKTKITRENKAKQKVEVK